MTPDETHELLKLVAAATRRTVGEEDVLIWHAVLAPLDPPRCRAAVLDHIRHRPGVWLEPGHVWAAARTVTDPAAETPPPDPDTGQRMRALLASVKIGHAAGTAVRTRVEPAPPWPWKPRDRAEDAIHQAMANSETRRAAAAQCDAEATP